MQEGSGEHSKRISLTELAENQLTWVCLSEVSLGKSYNFTESQCPHLWIWHSPCLSQRTTEENKHGQVCKPLCKLKKVPSHSVITFMGSGSINCWWLWLEMKPGSAVSFKKVARREEICSLQGLVEKVWEKGILILVLLILPFSCPSTQYQGLEPRILCAPGKLSRCVHLWVYLSLVLSGRQCSPLSHRTGDSGL